MAVSPARIRTGVVAEFDEQVGLGLISDASGSTFRFHSVEIADGSRSIEVGQPVMFQRLARFGEYQAGEVTPLSVDPSA